MLKHTRMTGLLLPLFSLLREGDDGIGDLKALEEWIDWAKDTHVSFLQLLPVNALGAGDAPSPYSSISSVALEPLYLTMERVPGAQAEDAASHRHTQALPPRQLPAGKHLVDYVRVRSAKEAQLRQAWERFRSEPSYQELRDECEQWAASEGSWLDDYSCYRVASIFFNSLCLWEWPVQEPDLIRNLVCNQEEMSELKDYHEWLQWLCAREWKQVREHADAAGVLLMGDIPIGISVASADVFFERHLFDMNWSGGSPAEGHFGQDPFTGKWGQNWGIPLYRWDHMEHDNYAWWGRRIRKMTEIFGMYRIDHILGFYRIYAFPWMPNRNPEFLDLSPDEAAARCEGRRPGFIPNGDWTPELRKRNLTQGDKLLREIMKRSQNAIVIGEDLGCVPDYVRPNLSQLRIAGFKIPHWEIDAHQNIIKGIAYNPCSFATYATHDFPPISEDWDSWYKIYQKAEALKKQSPTEKNHNKDILQSGKDCQQILHWLGDYAGLDHISCEQPWGEFIKDKLFSALFNCNSRYTALMWTELFDVRIRLNTPGTEGGCNWRARMEFTAAEASKLKQSAWLSSKLGVRS